MLLRAKRGKTSYICDGLNYISYLFALLVKILLKALNYNIFLFPLECIFKTTPTSKFSSP